MSGIGTQEGGSHYVAMKIQPVEFIHANGIPFIEGCVIKYVARWRSKGGLEDLRKAKHFLDILIELEQRNENPISREQAPAVPKKAISHLGPRPRQPRG